MPDGEPRIFRLKQSVDLIQMSIGSNHAAPMELAELLFNYVKRREVKDPDELRFG